MRRDRALSTPSNGRAIVTALALARPLHAGETGDARAADEAEQNGLGLIVGMMGGRDRAGADRPRMVDQQSVARLAGPLLHPGRGFGACPDERLVRDPEPCRERRDRLRLGGALRPQAMIDGGGGNACAAPSLPFGGHQEKRGRIRPPGDGDQQSPLTAIAARAIHRLAPATAGLRRAALNSDSSPFRARRVASSMRSHSDSACRTRRRWRRPDPSCRALRASGRGAPCSRARVTTY